MDKAKVGNKTAKEKKELARKLLAMSPNMRRTAMRLLGNRR